MKLFDYVPHDLFVEARANHLITEIEHPRLPLALYRYSPVCSLANLWDEATTKCRGLLVDTMTEEIVGPVIPKFFREEDWPVWLPKPRPTETKIITEKIDDVLVYVTQYEDELVVWTRSSFQNKAITLAKELLNSLNLDRVDLSMYTLAFGLVHPEQRVIVDYGDQRRLVLLDVLTKNPLRSLGPDESAFFAQLIFADSPEERQSVSSDDAEEDGVVVYYVESGLRMKVKTDWYMKRARYIPRVTSRNVLASVKSGSFWDWLAKCPDPRWAAWMESEADRFMELRAKRIDRATYFIKQAKTDLPEDASRAEYAQYWREHAVDVPSKQFFHLLDNRPVDWWAGIEAEPHRKPLAGHTIAI